MNIRGLCVLVGIGLVHGLASGAMLPASSSLEQSVEEQQSAYRPAIAARACVRTIRAIDERTTAAVTHRARAGVHRIVGLAFNGAPDDVIMQSAQRSIEAIHARAAAGAEHVNTAADRCVEALREAGADQERIELVQGARRRALEHIGEVAERAVHTVRDAADRVLND